jgi:hypothetical protein
LAVVAVAPPAVAAAVVDVEPSVSVDDVELALDVSTLSFFFPPQPAVSTNRAVRTIATLLMLARG